MSHTLSRLVHDPDTSTLTLSGFSSGHESATGRHAVYAQSS